jgi:hypothetical protein
VKAALRELDARDVEELASALLGREAVSHWTDQALDFRGIS